MSDLSINLKQGYGYGYPGLQGAVVAGRHSDVDFVLLPYPMGGSHV